MELITYDIHQPRTRYPGRKGIYPVIEDFNRLFKHLDSKPILASELDLETEEGQAKFNSVVYSSYDGDVFSNVPTCSCRYLSGGIKLKRQCPRCGTLCLPITEQPIEPLVWVECPPEMPGFMNLTIYRLLKKRFTKSLFSAIDYMLDPHYRVPKENSAEEAVLKQLKIPRGLTSFYKHFDRVIEALCNSRVYMSGAQGKRVKLFVDIHRDLVFCQYLPFPSKIGFIVEKVGNWTYVDPAMSPALDALQTLARCAKSSTTARNVIESRLARSFMRLDTYYSENEKDKLFDKKGVYRKLVYGVSPHFTFRTVITSHHRVHNHDSIATPWGVSVLAFKLHICNKLLKENYTPNEMNTLIYDSVWRPHYKLEQIFDELIAESPGGRGIPVGFTRFPSLNRTSTQGMYIDEIKRDPHQLSTSISVLSLNRAGADFDGDNMTGQVGLDAIDAAALRRLAPHTALPDMRVPFGISNAAAIPVPTLSTINARIEEGDDVCVPYGE